MRHTVSTLLVLGIATACSRAPASQGLDVVVQVASDDGAPFAAVPILVDGAAVATTDAQGRATASLVGKLGTRMRLSVECPESFRAPRTRTLTVRRGQGPLRVAMTCAPTERTAVVVVRAPGGEGVPLLADGEPVGEVGPDGTAHILLRRKPGTEVRLSMDTHARPRLRPADPAQRFLIEDRDALLVFDRAFEQLPRKRRKRMPKQPVTPAFVRPERIR